MQVSITFRCDNDAFAGHPGAEAARILRNVAMAAESSLDLKSLDNALVSDANGNAIGRILVIGR